MQSVLFRNARPLLAAGFLAVCSGAFSQTQEPAAPEFTRLVHTSKTAEEMQTRAVKLVPQNGSGPEIWLVGVAHIGRPEYYKSIQTLLDAQSLVLFEGVKPKGSQPSTPASFANKDKSMYHAFADAVGLDFQLFDIDYSKPNFQNSDLSWDEVNDLAAKQGKEAQGKVSMIEKLISPDSPIKPLLAMIKEDPGSQEAMRVVLVEALAKPGMMMSFLGEGTSNVIVKKRNEKVLQDLKGEMTRPSIAIFYGAAHMPDMEKSIVSGLQYKESGEKWLTAISADEAKVTGLQGPMMVQQFRMLMNAKKPVKTL
jgi:hypothetical protein